jgi:calcineurin-like phosphoesterase family protein
MRTWFTSDQHYGHHNIIEFCNRPWGDLEGMHNGLITRFNGLVHRDDIVYHLGDFSLQPKNVEPYLRQLHGRHFLVPGNHDACHPMHEGKRKRYVPPEQYIKWGFEDVAPNGMFLDVPPLGLVRLAHLPPTGGSRTEGDRYSGWRPQDNGWQFCGHVHDSWKRLGKAINVGVDVWNWEPVSLETLVAYVLS